MNAGTPSSRVVVLTELRMLFEERAIPAPTANRIVARRIVPGATARATPRALAGAMNHLPHSPRASEQIVRAPASAPLHSAPLRGTHQANAGRSLGSATAAPIWAWSSVGSAARRAFAAAPSTVAAGAASPARPTPPRREPGATTAPQGNQDGAAPRAVHIPSDVLRAMAVAAARSGRRESELWAEAAREWLDRQANHDDPPPAAAALAATPALRATRERCWSAIDILLSDLRAPDRAPASTPAATRATSWDGWDGWDGSAA